LDWEAPLTAAAPAAAAAAASHPEFADFAKWDKVGGVAISICVPCSTLLYISLSRLSPFFFNLN
jgi:hypothetical protein